MMSATATTPHHHRVPLATALAIAGAITAAVGLGFAWEQSHDSSKPAETTVVHTHPNRTSDAPNSTVAQQKLDAARAAQSEVPNSAIADQKLDAARARQSQAPNASVAERERLNAFQSPPGGKVQTGE
jgi:hypothetical protein